MCPFGVRVRPLIDSRDKLRSQKYLRVRACIVIINCLPSDKISGEKNDLFINRSFYVFECLKTYRFQNVSGLAVDSDVANSSGPNYIRYYVVKAQALRL